MTATTATRPRARLWMAISVSIVVVVAIALHFGTGIRVKGFIFDESYIAGPIVALIEQGWTLATAVDFEETKGPGLIWLYALAGEALGSSVNDLRLMSVICFVLGVLPLLHLARSAGLQGPALAGVALMYVLLPYHAVLSQMVMSEASFVLFSLIACSIFVQSLASTPVDDVPASNALRAFAGPALLAIMLSILLHNRVHALGLCAAIGLTAVQRLGWRGASKWIIAVAIAGISRIPLWVRWGGLVSPSYQSVHSVGFDARNMTYLLAAFAPLLGIFVLPLLVRKTGSNRWPTLAGGALSGVALAVAAPVDLARTFVYEGQQFAHYSGIVASACRLLSADTRLQNLMLAAAAIMGGAGLAALGWLAWSSTHAGLGNLINRLQFWTLCCGWLMYAMSATPVYDRYALAWSMLLPVCWILQLDPKLRLAQGALLLAMTAWLVRQWLL